MCVSECVHAKTTASGESEGGGWRRQWWRLWLRGGSSSDAASELHTLVTAVHPATPGPVSTQPACFGLRAFAAASIAAPLSVNASAPLCCPLRSPARLRRTAAAGPEARRGCVMAMGPAGLPRSLPPRFTREHIRRSPVVETVPCLSRCSYHAQYQTCLRFACTIRLHRYCCTPGYIYAS